MYLMIAGTMSNVGKSTLAMALCRYFTKKGLNVAPFKSQNMSRKFINIQNGKGKIAIAQYIQALACEKEPIMEFNPILIVPSEGKTQVYFMGEFIDYLTSERYMFDSKEKLFTQIKTILDRLSQKHDLVIIEGAGAFVEPNLKDTEIVNLRVAKSIGALVILVSDISRGGAFAQVAGTIELMDDEERKLLKGFVFTKFHGDKSLLKDAPENLAQKYSIEYLGTIPYFENKIPDEDLLTKKEGEVALDDKVQIIKEIDRITDFIVEYIDISKIERIIFERM
ncbi:cobyric acid synthase [Fervidobacterium sp.]